MADELGHAPLLSTPDNHIFESPASVVGAFSRLRLSNEQLAITYEIERTVAELHAGRWQRIALQFPDHMLVDSPRVFRALSRGLRRAIAPIGENGTSNAVGEASLESSQAKENQDHKLHILADTSYGACCVDEVAAEHADAQVVVHYGRSCLSPTLRLPIIYVFTKPSLDMDAVVDSFCATYPKLMEKVILVSDVPYISHLPELYDRVSSLGYKNIFKTDLVHDTSSLIPNRTIPDDAIQDPEILQQYQLFHVSDPPPALLLTLSSRVAAVHIFPTSEVESSPKVIAASSAAALRRRYAMLLQLSIVPIFGILVNTLSVANYMSVIAHVKQRIAEAGKKSYTFVVGKVNAAKVANFSEVGGWVVIGCWESSLFDSNDFWKPVITPFELEIALQGDSERVWTGQWSSDFKPLLEARKARPGDASVVSSSNGATCEKDTGAADDEDSFSESEPPEFDLRTGRYVSSTRPLRSAMRAKVSRDGIASGGTATTLVRRGNRDVVAIGSEASPAADFFRNKRSWQGLGSDFDVAYDEAGALVPQEAAVVEQGRSGIARGYAVGDGAKT